MSGDGYRRTVMAVSDLHQERRSDGERDKIRYKTIPTWISQYAEEFGADDLWVGGDSGNKKDVEALLGDSLDPTKIPEGDPRENYGFDQTKLVIGDEDESVSADHIGWYAAMIQDEDDGLQRRMEEDQHVEYGRKVSTVVPAERPYLVEMAHEPYEFGLDWTTKEEDLSGYTQHQLDQPKVVLYGHVHTPCARVVRNSVAIGMGSTAKNYANGEQQVWGETPERSMFVVSFSDDVDVYHIDLENDELFEYQRFEQTKHGFEEVDSEPRLPHESAQTGTDMRHSPVLSEVV